VGLLETAFTLIFEDLRVVYELIKNGQLEAREGLRFPVCPAIRTEGAPVCGNPRRPGIPRNPMRWVR
jgi:hypothetical protein